MTNKQHITIKGVKEGLVFLLDDQCEFPALMTELNHKLEKTHQKLLSGPLIHIHIKLGSRIITEEEQEQLISAISKRGNLLVQSIEPHHDNKAEADKNSSSLKLLTGVVRSGQTVEYDGNLLLMGDLNPGGTLMCTGDIYVMGSLRGMAHAGCQGRLDAIIAASQLRPTQLRIAEVISRPPDEWIVGDSLMEFAFLSSGQMQIDKISQLHRLRKEPVIFNI